ncbi:MAG: glycoside hydrolase family 2 TIM barrel-domain containing protein [Ignavibacteriaceae bacterium]
MKIFCLIFMSIVQMISAQTSPLIVNTDNRNTISLNGKWQTIIDPYEQGYYDYRYEPSKNGFFINQKPQSKNDLVEYDFDKSPLLNVPGDWNTQEEKLFLYEGTVWYKKDFDYIKKPGKRLFIYFGAVNYQADVYLNGEKLGEHIGGFTPFNFEITNLVKDRDNFVVVKVDNKRKREAVPTLNTDWWNYGGITRDVNLIEVPSTFIRDYFIQLRKGSLNHISGWIQLDGDKKTQNIIVKIPEANIEEKIKTNNEGFAKLDLDANLTRWSPENPKLYSVIIESETDTVKDQIGFRTIETKGTNILLNGKPIFLRGISIHEEAPIRSGRAFSKEDSEILLGWAKELNCNFVRFAHYPHNEHMVRMADKMGILVWSEIPVYWTILWDNQSTLENAKNQLREEITRDKNRAAIILWSMSNETPVNESRTKFLTSLADFARQLDSTRLLTAALERHYINDTTLMIDDPFGKNLDVIGDNEYIGWYDGLPSKADHLVWKCAYNKPVIISEFGAGALYGKHGDDLTRWTEEYQANVYSHQVNMLRKVPFIKGMTPWILMDFRSPRRVLPDIQDFWNRKGLISDRGERKEAFYILQKFYKELENK